MRILPQYASASYFFPLHGLVVHTSFTYATQKHPPPNVIGYNWIGVCYCCPHWNKRGEVCRVLFNFLRAVKV